MARVKKNLKMGEFFEHFFQVKSRKEVEDVITSSLRSLDTEEVPLDFLLGRVVGKTVIAPEPLPPFSRSTVDGFAVISEDTFGASEGFPALLKVVGSVSMGALPSFRIQRGEACDIPTGGALPEGADAVVMVEHTESPDPSLVEVFRPVSPLENVVRAGEDVDKGSVVLTRGQRIRPQELGLLSALGIKEVTVVKIPRVGIVSTGNEIVDPSESPRPGQIRDINRFTLKGLVERSGAQAVFVGLVPDEEAALREACQKGLEACDLLLLSGGSSVGTRDLTLKVLETFEDFELLVHGVAVSPGKPTIIARVGEKMIFGLPGHPVSTWIIAYLFVSRAIQALTGAYENPSVRWDQAIVDQNVPSAQGREDFVRAKVQGRGRAKTVTPVFSKSSVISSLVEANALIRVPLESEGVYKGEEVDILMLL